MRKIVLLLILACLFVCPAALADTVSFDDFSAQCKIAEDLYTLLTRDNLSARSAWLEKNGLTAEDVLADFEARGVYAQAWNAAGDVCIEISAVQDDFAAAYYDVNEISSDERKAYRTGHTTDSTGVWRAQGYDYSEAEWKNYKNIGRFLQVKYTRTVGGETYRGYARKTVRNGWHIHIDYQVYGRSLKTSDKTALENVMNSWAFLEVWPRPATSTSKLIFTKTPPAETNTGKFTVSGSGSQGLHLIVVAMRLTSPDPVIYETTVDKNGKFAVDVQLPREGFWLLTYTVENATSTIDEGVLNDGVTYDSALLPISFNAEVPATLQLTGNELVISGTTMKQTSIQCVVDGRDYNKTIKTNNSGEFSFKINTSAEGVYRITLVFQKKGYDSRRITCLATRTYTEQDRRENIRSEAVKPAYKTLKEKLTGYAGRYMVYPLYVREVTETATGYLTFAGMSRTKSGVYKDVVAIRSTEAPIYAAGDKVTMYLKCLGTTYEVIGDDGTSAYPYFDLQWAE